MKRGCGIFFYLLLLVGVAAPGLAYDNSPSNWKILPEVIWAPATGGGTWMTEVQIIDMEGTGTQVSVMFYHTAGQRGPFTLWTSPASWSSQTYSNILSTLQGLDPSFFYFGRVGALVFSTQSSANKIHVTAKTSNGNYAKTYPGLNNVQSNRVDIGVTEMIIPNVSNNAEYRTSIGYVKLSSAAAGMSFHIYDSTGTLVGSATYSLPADPQYRSYNPFTLCGLPYPTYSFSNCWIRIALWSDGTAVFPFGAIANNTTNDPSAIIAVQRY
ncbi:MAG: hypothetical protein OEW05_02500 [Candidatus Aminicenantes bacterium]|nr:hypothetical protein [Candidatus Aminicenantes bacterium]